MVLIQLCWDVSLITRIFNELFLNSTLSIVAILAIIFLLLVIMAILIGRYLSRHKGEYLTQEDKGADDAMDPDEAVVHGHTGHQVTKRKEWFI